MLKNLCQFSGSHSNLIRERDSSLTTYKKGPFVKFLLMIPLSVSDKQKKVVDNFFFFRPSFFQTRPRTKLRRQVKICGFYCILWKTSQNVNSFVNKSQKMAIFVFTFNPNFMPLVLNSKPPKPKAFSEVKPKFTHKWWYKEFNYSPHTLFVDEDMRVINQYELLWVFFCNKGQIRLEAVNFQLQGKKGIHLFLHFKPQQKQSSTAINV